jgi:NAD(P)-dependent dehydrogenase (short-subunit alcohol dehydrogenase family)
MIGFSKALAQEVASRGVTVNCVAPGFIESPMTDALNEQQKAADPVDDSRRRLGQGAEIAAACAISPATRRLRHRADAACEWRHGDDLNIWSPNAEHATRSATLVTEHWRRLTSDNRRRRCNATLSL